METREKEFRVGLIGAGNISGAHLRALGKDSSANASIVGVSDLDSEEGRAKAGRVAAETETAQVYHNARALIDDPKIDVVAVLTPPDSHAELVIAALKAGKHVICEKPMAMSVAECDAILAAAERSPGKLFVVQNRIYTEAMQAMKHLIDDGVIGEVLKVSSKGQEGEELAGRMPSILSDERGVIATQAIHQTYVVPWLLGRDIRSISTFTSGLSTADMTATDATAISVLRYDNGLLQAMDNTFALSDGRTEHTLEVCGKLGDLRSARVGGQGNRTEILQRRPRGEETWQDVDLKNPRVIGPEFEAMWRDFLNSVRTGEPPQRTAETARRSLYLVDLMYKSAKQGGAPVYPEQDSSASRAVARTPIGFRRARTPAPPRGTHRKRRTA